MGFGRRAIGARWSRSAVSNATLVGGRTMEDGRQESFIVICDLFGAFSGIIWDLLGTKGGLSISGFDGCFMVAVHSLQYCPRGHVDGPLAATDQ